MTPRILPRFDWTHACSFVCDEWDCPARSTCEVAESDSTNRTSAGVCHSAFTFPGVTEFLQPGIADICSNIANSCIRLIAPTSQPVLPVIAVKHVPCKKSVGHRVRHDAVGQSACPDHPPVVEDACEQAYVAVGTVLGSKQDGGDPERI